MKPKLHVPDSLPVYLMAAFLVIVHGPLAFLIMAFVIWYIGRIPQRKVPLAAFLGNNHSKFYSFAIKLLKQTLLGGLGMYAFLAIPVIGLVALKVVPLPWLILLQLLAPVCIALSFLTVKQIEFDPLLRFADAGARALVGSDEYDKMSEEEKNKVKRNLVDSEIGINKATVVVAEGKTIIKNEPAEKLARFGGPGVLIVQEAHAVILEQSGRISRVVGRGRTFLEQFERVSMVIPLNSQRDTLEIKNIVTQDQIVIPCLQVYLFHRVDPGDKSHPNGLFPYDHKNVLKVWNMKGNLWNGLVTGIAESVVRDVVARHTLDELMMAAADVRTLICEDIRSAINSAVSAFGILTTIVRIGELQVPKDVEEKLRERWMANVIRQTELIRAEQARDTLVLKGDGQAQVLRKVEMIKASLRETLIHQLTDPFGGPTSAVMQNREMASRFIDAVERLSSGIMRDDVTALRYIEALENMAKGDGPKTFIVGESKGLLEAPSGDISTSV